MSPIDRERRLRTRAAESPGFDDWRTLDTAALAGVARREGIDFATALLCDRLARAPETCAMLQAVEETTAAACVQPPIVLVPGAGYREYPETGAGGERIRRLFPNTRTIPVASFGTSRSNAQMIIDWLLACRERDLVLVSLSKGSADVRRSFAHERAAEAFSCVHTWINLSGIPFGTPLAGWILQRPVQRWAVKLLCWWRGLPFDLLGSLDRDADGELAPPTRLRVLHVVGFPLIAHLTSKRARRCQRRLAALGPSDGGGFLLGDVTRLPGIVLPVWGADHYLQPAERFDPLIARLVTLVARDTVSSPVPMNQESHG